MSETNFIQVVDVTTASNFDRVCCVDVKVKVLKVNTPTHVSSGKCKQDIISGDKSSAIKLTSTKSETWLLENAMLLRR